jgi:hypothetical protein
VRNNAMRALALIAMLGERDRTLGIVVPPTPFVDLARWKSRGHAASAFLVLGRLVGLKDDEVKAAFERDDRALVLDAAAKFGK